MSASPVSPRQTLVKRALGGHAAIGLLASALIYIICLSGTLVVIHDRWQRWEQPDVPEMIALAPAAVQRAITGAVAREAGKPATTHLYVRMPSTELPRASVTTDSGGWYVDADGRIVAREGHAWTDFMIAMHEYLHLPMTWGLILVGALGVMLCALVTTGVLAHPRIIRDAFCLRARHDAQLARADWHNRLGVWTLPFVLAVALTGAFIGLGGVGTTMLAKAYTSGDTLKVYAHIFGHEPPSDPARTGIADAAAALRTLDARVPGAMPTYVIVHEPGTAGQHIQILTAQPKRLVYGESYFFDRTGAFHSKAGLSDGAVGQQVAASSYNLHFGNFAGLPVEIAYMVMGLALCAITATGNTLWLEKRRRRGLGGERLRAGWNMTVWGTPTLIVWALWLRAGMGAEAPLALVFWSAFAAALVVAVLYPRVAEAMLLRRVCAGSVLLTAIGHLVLLRPAIAEPVVIDLVAIGLSVPLLLWGMRARRTARRASIKADPTLA
ncbi:PepSY domain-containing protein [uncultured Sphingomonas sp.]|uniref:PepSY-associated TM helix domain-containing protein n=1 Tax=uncultured Sphingomonas sp. TaxID=158754 RepID=UPI0025E886A9|nr:PepSY-associated TM helix domain-containing protein [uncultured Sphingomonas sp.]